MPTLDEIKGQVDYLIREGRGKEKAALILPRQDARERIENPHKRKRIVMVTDPANYAEFHAMREAYMQALGENPTLVTHAIIEAMRNFDVKGWAEEQEATPVESVVPKAQIPPMA